jgi:hypothetical protein
MKSPAYGRSALSCEFSELPYMIAFAAVYLTSLIFETLVHFSLSGAEAKKSPRDAGFFQ